MILAVVIPVFNERELLPRLIDRIDATPRPKDANGSQVTRLLILADDGSTDSTDDWIAENLADREDCVCLFTSTNGGKGSALARGFEAARRVGAGAALVQDADLEYHPADHQPALDPIFAGEADAVIGSRFIGGTHRVLYYWHSIANRGITTLSNMLSNLNLTDIECGTKAFSADVLARLVITEPRFGVEPEIIAKLAKMRLPETGPRGGSRPLRIFEVPVRYAGRTYAEGKKIGWRDGVEALRCIAQHNLFARRGERAADHAPAHEPAQKPTP
ncbi:MAG: glycosyltransferase family 2 protein [Planctomycetota bacterium]